MLRNGIVGVGVLALSSCASGVHFNGQRQPPVVSAAGVQVGAHPPEATRRLGRASAECTPLAPDREFEGVRFSDLSCSAALLHAALREAAARAGGSFSSTPECQENRSSSRAGTRLSWLACDADVWGPDTAGAAGVPAPLEPPALPVAAGAPLLGSARDAWHISLDFWPAAPSPRRAARDPESVAEVDFPRVGQRRLGDLSAACDSGCATDSLRRGLRAAAAWLGASTLVDVRCIQRERATSCAASISSPEWDEETSAGAPLVERR